MVNFRKQRVCFIFNQDSLYLTLNSHYEAWSYKKKKHKNRAYRKSVQKETTAKRSLLIIDVKAKRSQVKGKHSIGRDFQSLVCQERNCGHRHPYNIQRWLQKNHAIYENNEQTSLEKKENNTYIKDLSWPHFGAEPRVQEKEKVKGQQSCIFVFVVCLTIPSRNQGH